MRYRHVWPGFLLLGSLAVSLVALAGLGDQAGIRIVAAMPLRTAVRIAGRLRGAGHDPRVAVEALRAGHLALRHGHFTSREEAEAVKSEIERFGVTAEVVRIP